MVMHEILLLNPYLRALALFVVLLIVLKIALHIILRITLRLTKKTKTDVDDKIVSKSSKPLSILTLLISLLFALRELPLEPLLGNLSNRMLYSGVVLVIAYMVFVMTDIALMRAVYKVAAKVSPGAAKNLNIFIQASLKIGLVVISIIYILNIWGIEIGPLLAGLGIAGLAVALALQSTLSNIFSGISMILDKTLRVGDLIYVDSETKGTVERIGIRSTQIRTFDNEMIILPNNKLAENKIQNVTLPEPKTRVVVPFGVAYGSDIEKVKKIVLKEIKSIKHFVSEPAPRVRFLEMANSSLDFKAYFYVDTFEEKWNALDEANTKIYNALNKAGISIPFPQLDVHMKSDGVKKKS